MFFVTDFTCKDRKRAIVSGDLAACDCVLVWWEVVLLVGGCGTTSTSTSPRWENWSET